MAHSDRRWSSIPMRLSPTTVGELAELFELSPPAISKQLKVLQKAGLVEQGRQAQWRPCRLRPEPLQEVAAWMAQYRQFLGQSFDRLDDYLKHLRSQAGQEGTREGEGQ